MTTDFYRTDSPMSSSPLMQPRQTLDCESLSRMSLPALLYHALVELAQPTDRYCLPV